MWPPCSRNRVVGGERMFWAHRRQTGDWGFTRFCKTRHQRLMSPEKWLRAGRESPLQDDMPSTGPYHQKKETVRLRFVSCGRAKHHFWTHVQRSRRPHLHSVNLPRRGKITTYGISKSLYACLLQLSQVESTGRKCRLRPMTSSLNCRGRDDHLGSRRVAPGNFTPRPSQIRA